MTWTDAAIELMPASLREHLPALYSQEHNPNAVALVKLFCPDCGWTWFIVEGGYVDDFGQMLAPDADTREAADYLVYCLVDGLEREWGYASLTELAAVRGPLGLPVERDLHWRPCRVSEL